MTNANMDRRSFIGASAIGAAALAAGTIFRASAAEKPAASPMKLFVCSVCGHVEIGAAPEVCPLCHSPMEKFGRDDALFSDAMAKTPELAIDHVPEITVDKSSKLIVEQPVKVVNVRVGRKLHPMLDAHHIQWIDCYVDDHFISRSSLTPGSNPAVTFYPGMNGSKVRVVEHCNLHGHWQAGAVL